ncbi:hypothetical protein SAMN04487949_0214 [Halogranum gelatinilyticum]|uniref:Uncharacterized protein n=1 Tax=Halogranum gelatinilyticum TaxID=660521 RepID=A0A1G9P4C9_9EURY|nr:DUF5784 family protein [Halogranum gelatinilyticum]SDL93045.1 hypothetical protein SAMN04487949_0214 [Halogranum gelatinilyticum]
MARPLRFRHAPGRWTVGRVRNDVFQPLDGNLGAEMTAPWFRSPDGYDARRFEMDNGDIALFAWNDDEAYWLGNTETPSSLWRTEKYGFSEVPYPIARWAERELLAQLHEESPWLEPYPHVSWFFLPVFLSKDGRHTTREFFHDHAAGFPDATRDEALDFYERFLHTGALDEYRELMAGKLGTSERIDLVRMAASMGEFNVAKVLHDAGYDLTPEIEVTTGHSLDYRADRNGDGGTLVEVTRPLPPNKRSANTPVAAVRDTAETKTNGQLEHHAGGVTLFVDCSSFPDDDWFAVRGEQPEVRHRPAVVFRARPDGHIEGYSKGSVPLDLDGGLEWV